MKIIIKQMLLITVIFTSLITLENKIIAGSGAAWGGLAGGLIVGSAIANSNRNREVVYVNNDNPPRHHGHKEQRRLNKQQAELNKQQAMLNQQRAELNREKARLNHQAEQLGY